MSDAPDWLPNQLEFTGEWEPFVNGVYERFCADLVHSRTQFQGKTVSVRRHPEARGKGFGFWHCVSEGGLEDVRTPDLERCRRIGWIRAIIEHCERPEVEHWTNRRRGEMCHLLWYKEEYLVVLAKRADYFLLKTAYSTDREHTRRKLRKERDRAKNG